MKKVFIALISLMLAAQIAVSGALPVFAQSEEASSLSDTSSDVAEIVSSDMSIESAESNLTGYYSATDWTAAYPDGLFIVEYNTYELSEGGTDPENPEDVYLGVVVHRIGGCSQAATVTYSLSCIMGDYEAYPDSMGEIYFAPQAESATAKIKIKNDDKRTGNQLLLMMLEEATYGDISVASSCAIKIFDDEPYETPEITMSVKQTVTDKADGNVSIVFVREGGETEFCSFTVKTKNGTAKAGTDYESVEEEIIFISGQTEQTLTVPLVQSDDKFESPRWFSLTVSDPKGCELAVDDTIRLNITNKLENEATVLTPVDDFTADFEQDVESSLSDSATSLINVNDNIDRAELLRTAIGSVNGTAVQSVNAAFYKTATQSTGAWEKDVDIYPSEFVQRYCSYKSWSSDSTYSYGNEDLLITTSKSYNLNHFSSVAIEFVNKNTRDVRGNPNTAFGYLTANGSSDKDEWPGYIKNDLSSSSDITWMTENDIYFLKNYNHSNVDLIDNPEEYSFGDSDRFYASSGYEGSDQKLFFMLYDDEEWDDHNFSLNVTTLKRTVIPFSVFMNNSAIESLKFNIDESDLNKSTVTFTLENYEWTLSVNTTLGGGVGEVDDPMGKELYDLYGIFVGSNLTVTGKSLSSSNTAVPEYIYLCDEKGTIHNSAENTSSTGVSFNIKFETLMETDTDVLMEKYHMTQEQADKHVAETINAENCINSTYYTRDDYSNGCGLTFDVAFSLHHNVSVNFKNVPTLAKAKMNSDGTIETTAEHQTRVYEALKDILKFYDTQGNEITPGYSVDVSTNSCIIGYESTEFDYITVDPAKVDSSLGTEFLIGTNLYELDYQEISSFTEISGESCAQIKTGLLLTVYDENTTYVDPTVMIGTTAVATKSDGEYDIRYSASNIDDYVPYETLYYDATANPPIMYYTVRFTISDIYVGKKSGTPKDFEVTVYYQQTSGGTNEPLFTFTFRGGSDFATAQDVALDVSNSRFTAVDSSTNPAVDSAAFKPEVKLLSYSASGYEYIMYIPTYYNYQEPTGELASVYNYLFKGNDGIGIEISSYDKNTANTNSANDDGTNEVVFSLDINETQYVCTKIPNPTINTGDAEVLEGPYFEEQQNFYTYNEHRVALYGFKLGMDLSSLPLFFTKINAAKGNSSAAKWSKRLLNTGPYVQYGDGTIVVGFRIGASSFESVPSSKNESFDDSVVSDSDSLIVKPTTGSVSENEIEMTDSSDILDTDDMLQANGAQQQGTSLTSKVNAKTASFSLSLAGDVRVQLVYNKLDHSWDFNQFSVSLSLAAGFSATVPIPPLADAVYFSFSTKVAITVATGFSHMLDYIDDSGVPHYKVTWNGFPISPSFSVSVGVGVGLSGILALEAGGAVDLSLSAVLGKYIYVGPQQEFDIAIDSASNPYDLDFYGDWRNYTSAAEDELKINDLYYLCYGNTLCKSHDVGDRLEFNAKGTSVQIVGTKSTDGGKMRVSVYDITAQQLLKSEEVSMYADSLRPYETVFYWSLENYTEDTSENREFAFRVVIENISDEDERTILALDSMRVYNHTFREENTDFGFIAGINFKLSAFVKLCILGITFSLEPAYMLIDYTGTGASESATLTIGSFRYKQVYDISSAQADDEDIPVLTAESPLRAASSEGADYFDTGEYAELKTKTLLMDHVENTAKTQVISHNGDTFAFYTVTQTGADGKTSNYQLYYAKNGVGCGLVCESIYIIDFNAFIDADEQLTVAISANDSTVSSLVNNDDETSVLTLEDGTVINITDTSQLTELMTRTCVKVAVYNDTEEVFDDVYTVEGTDGNGVQESLIAGVSNVDVKKTSDTARSAAFYVVDSKTDAEAEYNLNWTGFNDGTAGTSDITSGLFNSMYKGSAEIHYTVATADGYSESKAVALDSVLKKMVKAGFKITSLDVVAADAEIVCIAYSVELPYAVKNGHVGTLKQIHYRKGVFSEDGSSIDFGDTVVIDSVVDYDDDVTEVFGENAEIPSVYYNSDSGEYYNSIILGAVQIENAVMCTNGESVRDYDPEPCVYYRTNAGINYITYASLNAAEEGTVTVDDKVRQLYEGSYDDYIIATDYDGVVYLIYNNPDNDDGYCDELMIAQYNADDEVWNKPRALTYTDAYDAEAHENRMETGSVSFAEYSAFVTSKGKVAVAMRSSYIPFSYDYYTDESLLSTDYDVDFSKYYDTYYVDDEGNIKPAVTVDTLDYSSEKARSDIFMITFDKTSTSVEISDMEISNKVFAPGETVNVALTIKNTGDYSIKDMELSLYYRGVDNSVTTLTSQSLSGALLSGDSYFAEIGYTVDSERIPDGTLLGVLLKDKNGMRTLYDSYNSYQLNSDTDTENDVEACYHIINNCAELVFESTNVDIDSNGILTYKANIMNAGTVDAQSNPVISCNVYSVNEETNEYIFENTIFRFTVPASKLKTGSIAYVTNQYNVADYLDENGNLYFNFEINTSDAQFDTDNDVLDVAPCQQIPDVEVESVVKANGSPVLMNGITVRNIMLGDEVIISGDVIAKAFDNSSLRLYEVGSDCLSIDNSSPDGTIKIKAVALPDNSEGYVKLLLNIKDTAIYRYMYLYVSNKDFVDFNESNSVSGWSITGENRVYAINYDMLTTEIDGSELTFDFVGEDVRIYGDQLANGGEFEIEIINSSGKTVAKDTVSVKSDLDNVGMLLYQSDKYANDRYTVRIRALLDDGEMIALDSAKFTIDTSSVDTTEYAKVTLVDEVLDAPLLSGRSRNAVFTLDFNSDICLADGKSLEDITVTFDEYESKDGSFVRTGNTVTFTATEIRDNRQLVFTGSLSSTPGSVLRYVLSSSDIPDGCIITAESGNGVKTAIPGYGSVSYTLKESGIMSVVVDDDVNMPDGSVHKSVKVKFMTAPDVNRLEGTKIVYTTVDADGSEREVDFMYAQLTEDPRVAVYRAESLELSEEETEKLFSFNKGIVLNENNYVLVTADGDYLENDVTTVISDTSLLDIEYKKLSNESAPVFSVVSENGRKILAMDAEFGSQLDISNVLENGEASVTVKEIVTDNITGEVTENDLKLTVTDGDSDTAVRFEYDITDSFTSGVTLQYELVSSKVEYSGENTILNDYDGISVNPRLETASKLIFNTDAFISEAEIYFEDGSFVSENNVLCARVMFSSAVKPESLENTSLKVYEHVTCYDKTVTNELVLEFVSVETKTSDSGAYSVAYYRYNAGDIVFGDEETAKTFTVADSLTVAENSAIVTEDGTHTFLNSILSGNSLVIEKTKAASTYLSLEENGEYGYTVVLTVDFTSELNVNDINKVYILAIKEDSVSEETIALKLNSVKGTKAVFASEIPITLAADRVTTITTESKIVDTFAELTDNNGIAVSEYIGNVSLVCDMTDIGVAESAVVTADAGDDNKLMLSLYVTYDQKLRELSFAKSTVDAYVYIEYINGLHSMTVTPLTFDSLDGEYTAVYKAEILIPDDAVSIQISSGDSISTSGGSLFNTTKTLSLCKEIPKSLVTNVKRLSVSEILALNISDNEKIEKLSDINICVTFSGKIVAENPEGITINVGVTGIDGIDSVVFRANGTVNGNTIVFVPVTDYDLSETNIISIVLDNAKINVADGSKIYGTNGLSVTPALPDLDEKFICIGQDNEPDVPVNPEEPSSEADKPDETTTIDDTTTNIDETTTVSQTAAGTTTAAATTDNADSTVVGNMPTTGDTAIFVGVAAVLLTALAVILVCKKREDK